jgi:hypothetical protein
VKDSALFSWYSCFTVAFPSKCKGAVESIGSMGCIEAVPTHFLLSTFYFVLTLTQHFPLSKHFTYCDSSVRLRLPVEPS